VKSGPRKTDSTASPLPQNLEAEQAVLGAVLLDESRDNSALSRARAILTPADFFHDQHRRIFASMIQLDQDQQPSDLIMTTELLSRKGELELAGGAAYLSQLIDGRQQRSNIECYARLVKDKSLLRRLAHAGERIRETAMHGEQDVSTILDSARLELSDLDLPATNDIFDTSPEWEETAEATFSITDFLQDYAVTAIAALTGHGKTWLTLNIVAALLFGPGLLWDLFRVNERAAKILYFIPEVGRETFKPRLQITNVYDELNKRLFIRTLSKGPALPLTDPRILREAKGAHVICDTAIRFMKAVDENSANEAAAALSADFFALQRAEAKSIIALFHSPKSFATQTYMSVENMIRGSGEFGAVLATAWGLRQIDKTANVVHVECLKDRDVAASAPFQLIGRPYLDQEGFFRLHARPGSCGPLADYLDGKKNKGGAPAETREGRAAKLQLLREWIASNPNQTSEQLSARFKAAGFDVSAVTVRRYKQELDRDK